MAERWFSDEDLAEMARPTMDRASEAIERGDGEQAKKLCEAMKHESQFMHDLLVDGVAGLISFVKDELGDEAVERAWTYSLERSWKRPVETIATSDRREVAKALAATWRAHSTSGVGPSPGAFEIAEADAFLTRRGLVLRALNNYSLPHALRMTIGTEEANRLVVDGLRDFMAHK